MVVLPAATPLTTPVAEFTEAAAGLLLLQIPPVVPLLVNVTDKPAHTAEAPFTTPAFGTGFTVTIVETELFAQSDDTLYVIVAVPVPMPKTIPLASTIAAAGLLLLHDPPGVPLLVKLIVEPAHTADGPLIVPALATGLTTILNVVNDDPQLLETK